VGDLAPNEQMVYNYWFVTLSLLEVGLPWETIQGFNEDEISMVLAVNLAKKEKQNEDEARQQQMAMRK
jgi:hypothetical protein